MRIASLCSSSAANSSYIGSADSGVLVDVGCSYKSLLNRLSLCRTDISAVKVVLITHEHTDHIKGLKQFTKHSDVPVYASRKTGEFLLAGGHISKRENLFELSELGRIPADFEIKAFRTPHDSVESVGFSFVAPSGYKIAYFTDLGEITDSVREGAKGADFVFIEANYAPDVLAGNALYPAYVKERIASPVGHLSNDDSALYISHLVSNGTTRVMLAHLSRENNSPKRAFVAVAGKLSERGMRLNRDYTLDVAGVDNTAGEYIAV
ncbi:MAG: MBL fold metallo-hydrolase [Oscillospiraceae bacterium]|jgi:phosphoribosyl 1,2-cyclic phosphodiesterase|nr:MBL fold metallo-hydrolase [Oscillospiraceae bacterium]